MQDCLGSLCMIPLHLISSLVFNQCDRTTWDFTFCKQITDLSLSHLTTNVLRIIKLDLSHCKSITSNGITILADAFKSSNTIRELFLNWLPHLSDSSLINLANSCPSLTHLSVRGTSTNYFSVLLTNKKPFLFRFRTFNSIQKCQSSFI